MVDAVHECKFHLRVIHSHRLHTMWRSKNIFYLHVVLQCENLGR